MACTQKAQKPCLFIFFLLLLILRHRQTKRSSGFLVEIYLRNATHRRSTGMLHTYTERSMG